MQFELLKQVSGEISLSFSPGRFQQYVTAAVLQLFVVFETFCQSDQGCVFVVVNAFTSKMSFVTSSLL